MSLINDALKRANEQKAKQVTAGELGSSMQVVDSSREETKLWPIALFAVLLVGALWLGWSGLHSNSNSEGTASNPPEVNARGSEASVPPASPSVAEVPAKSSPVAEPPAPEVARAVVPPSPRAPEPSAAPPRAAVVAKPELPAVAAVPSSAPAVGPAVTPPSAPTAPIANTFPQLSLQGIYYRPSRPSAVINSKTVFVGDKVQQAKVLAIDRYEVTVQWNNEVRVLAFQ